MDAMVGSRRRHAHRARRSSAAMRASPRRSARRWSTALLDLGAGEILAEIRDADDVDGLLKT